MDTLFALSAFITLLTGVIQALALKCQDRTVQSSEYSSEPTNIYFAHPILQTLIFFLSESFAVLPLLPNCSLLSSSSFKWTWFWWITPAPFDLCETLLLNVAVTITYSSTVQMLHNFIVIASAFLSMIILKKALRVHQWMGCILVTIALVYGTIPALRGTPETQTNFTRTSHWIGVMCALLSTSVHAFQNIWEEALMRKFPVTSTQAIATEGIAGAILTTFILILANQWNIEDTVQGYTQIKQNTQLKVAIVAYAIASLVNNLSGVYITKLTSGLSRCIILALKPPLVWIAELLLRWNTFTAANLISMALVLLGLSLYLLSYPWNVWTISRPILLYPITFGLPILQEEQQTVDDASMIELRTMELRENNHDGAQYPGSKNTTPASHAIVYREMQELDTASSPTAVPAGGDAEEV